MSEEGYSSYVQSLIGELDPALAGIMARAREEGIPSWAVDPESRRMLEILVKVSGARRVLEIGTLAGSSAISMARLMPADGRLITIEAEPKHALFARQAIAEVGLDKVIEVWEGKALDLLPKAAGEGPFDLCFIDADKDNEEAYIRWALENVRIGGVIGVHNAFGYGSLSAGRPGFTSSVTHAVNLALAKSPKALTTIVPSGDGLLLGVVIA